MNKKFPPISNKLKKLLKDYADWYVEMRLIGARYPDEWDSVKQKFDKSKERLIKYLSEIECVYEDTMKKRFPV